MGTKDALRDRVRRLLELGVTQKQIAAKMGIARAAFNRWVHGEDARISVDALDAFNAYVQELAAALDLETQRADASATAGSLQRSDSGRRVVDLGHGPAGELRRASDPRPDRVAPKAGSRA